MDFILDANHLKKKNCYRLECRDLLCRPFPFILLFLFYFQAFIVMVNLIESASQVLSTFMTISLHILYMHFVLKPLYFYLKFL